MYVSPELKTFLRSFIETVKVRISAHALKTRYRNNVPIISLVILAFSIPLIIYMSGKASESLSQSSLLCTRQAMVLTFKRKKIDKLLRQLLPSEALIRYLSTLRWERVTLNSGCNCNKEVISCF